MGAGHVHALYVHEHSRIHSLPPEVKVAAVFLFVLAVAVTPPRQVWAFGIYALMLGSAVIVGCVPWRFFFIRLAGIAPFVLFAFLIPFVATGERIDLGWVSVSLEGLWAAWGILAKAVLGAGTTIVLVATTEVAAILRGMRVVRVPVVFVSIAGFMIRYLELIADELGRMRQAMTARGHDPRWLWQIRPMASAAGALFVRAYERGERVYSAMLARGFNGEMPPMGSVAAKPSTWAWALTAPGVAALVAIYAVVTA